MALLMTRERWGSLLDNAEHPVFMEHMQNEMKAECDGETAGVWRAPLDTVNRKCGM